MSEATVPLGQAIGDAEAAGWTATPRRRDVVFERPGGGGLRVDLCPGGILRFDHQRLLDLIASSAPTPAPVAPLRQPGVGPVRERVRACLAPWPHLVEEAVRMVTIGSVGGWLCVWPHDGRIVVCAAPADLLWQVVKGGGMVCVLDLKEPS